MQAFCLIHNEPYKLLRSILGSHLGAKFRAILRLFFRYLPLVGISIVKYFISFFKAVGNGSTDYDDIHPATVSV